MIKKFVLWYLAKKSFPYCALSENCIHCPFGSDECNCGVTLIKKALSEI